jgi:hypothetical protein
MTSDRVVSLAAQRRARKKLSPVLHRLEVGESARRPPDLVTLIDEMIDAIDNFDPDRAFRAAAASATYVRENESIVNRRHHDCPKCGRLCASCGHVCRIHRGPCSYKSYMGCGCEKRVEPAASDPREAIVPPAAIIPEEPEVKVTRITPYPAPGAIGYAVTREGEVLGYVVLSCRRGSYRATDATGRILGSWEKSQRAAVEAVVKMHVNRRHPDDPTCGRFCVSCGHTCVAHRWKACGGSSCACPEWVEPESGDDFLDHLLD